MNFAIAVVFVVASVAVIRRCFREAAAEDRDREFAILRQIDREQEAARRRRVVGRITTWAEREPDRYADEEAPQAG